ncbi:MAG: pentapeptide repeat-containing protein [Cyanobacteria bacterium J06628_3]
MKDFSGRNLNSRSFRGQNLTGANFSQANIRGVDFSHAILKNANFSNVVGGLPRKWLITFILISHSLAILSTLSSIGFISVVRFSIGNDFFESNLIFFKKLRLAAINIDAKYKATPKLINIKLLFVIAF